MSKDDDATDEEITNIGVGRYPCMPSLVALQQMRNRLHLAYLGRKLMKWTALATGRELRKIATDLNETYDDFREDLANAYILLARSRFYYDNLNKIVIEDVQKQAAISLETTVKTVSAGVKCITYEIIESTNPPYPHLGIEKGGQTILEAKIAWANILKRMILILQLRNSFTAVDAAHRAATKKQNVLQKIIIPKTQSTIHYILLELEELAREELFRIKKVVQAKQRKLDLRKKPEEIPVPKPKPKPIPPAEPSKPILKPEPCIVIVAEQPSESESEEEICMLKQQPCPMMVCKGPTAATPDHNKLNDIIKCLDFSKIKPPQSPVVSGSLHKLLKRVLSDTLRVKLQQIRSKSNIDYFKSEVDNRLRSSKSPTKIKTISFENFRQQCEGASTKMSQQPTQPLLKNDNTERLLQLKKNVANIKIACNDLKSKMKDSGSVTDLLHKCEQVDKRVDELMGKQKNSDRNKQLDILRNNIQYIENITREFRNQCLNIPGAENFIVHCRKVQSILKSHYYKEKEEPKENKKLQFLQSQVANVEDMAKTVDSKSLEKFSKCCQDFRAKIESYEKQPALSESALKLVIDRLDQVIDLTKYAKEDGFVDESFENFIGSCKKTKQHLLDSQKFRSNQLSSSHPVLGELKKSIEDTMDLVNKMKREGLITDSMTDFMSSCQHTRETIAINETALKPEKESCQCELCVCTSEKFYAKIHEFIRSTKREPMNPSKEQSDIQKHSSASFTPSCMSLKLDDRSSIQLSSTGRNVRIMDDGENFFDEDVTEIVKIETFVNDDGTISQVKERIRFTDDIEKPTALNDSKSVNDNSTSKKAPSDSHDKNRTEDKDVAYCCTSNNAFRFLMPVRRVKSESICVADPITLPSLRHCISVTLYNHSDIDLSCYSSHSILENLHIYSEICN